MEFAKCQEGPGIAFLGLGFKDIDTVLVLAQIVAQSTHGSPALFHKGAPCGRLCL